MEGRHEIAHGLARVKLGEGKGAGGSTNNVGFGSRVAAAG